MLPFQFCAAGVGHWIACAQFRLAPAVDIAVEPVHLIVGHRRIRGKRIAVLGRGPHGFAEASFILPYSPLVTLIPPDCSLAVARDGIAVLDAPQKKFALTKSEVVVTLQNGDVRHFDTMYVALGTTPQTHLAARLSVALDDAGYVKVNVKQKSSVAQIYAIGDFVDWLGQIVVGMVQAAIAALAIHNDLSKVRPPDKR